nr:MAG TPA: hypothetical protein [Caudoviricetes sp.]
MIPPPFRKIEKTFGNRGWELFPIARTFENIFS